ncbi:MAG TPA: phosphate ABC transporter permease subunit PstC [Bryobacteraceae bacterium]|jgi:phosphate transport system permease protein|nr:phosphate ABC transporter permease subunit PstC [Bryobacteraceae bacterium]
MSAPAITAGGTGRTKGFLSSLRGGDAIAHGVAFLFASTVLVVTLVLVWELWTHSELSRHKFGFNFLFTQDWDPGNGQFGALPFVYGTILTSVVALAISVPLGVGAAIFLAELAPRRVSDWLTFLVELLAAVPSVIYGLIAVFTLIPLMRDYIEPLIKHTLGELPAIGRFFSGPATGGGYLTAGVILAIMTFPFIISISREALLEVPRDQREAALALGATKWESTIQVVVPYARLGIFGSIFLALARALGETMAVTMVIGNDTTLHPSLLASGYTIASVIANEFAEASDNLHLSSLIEVGLVLFVITIIINALARVLVIATSGKGTARTS